MSDSYYEAPVDGYYKMLNGNLEFHKKGTKLQNAVEFIRFTLNQPYYYKHPSGIECIEVARHSNFNIGNALKYLWRHGQKGPAVEDLKKALWYIEDEIKRLETQTARVDVPE